MNCTAGAWWLATTQIPREPEQDLVFSSISGMGPSKAQPDVLQWKPRISKHCSAGWIRRNIQCSSNFPKLNTCVISLRGHCRRTTHSEQFRNHLVAPDKFRLPRDAGRSHPLVTAASADRHLKVNWAHPGSHSRVRLLPAGPPARLQAIPSPTREVCRWSRAPDPCA